ncbi:NUDIX domain-containing protein [Phaeovulum sp. NW3]|uniref:NUDIX domain-containing protein n=1 Tax=Phaeovulum sp. NW3 TaxID=2934933 RepID=UPI002021A00B|nr:NUDIX domain-containing protein [Phaeovulum sp. NW3]MCL7466419.1 NUDIX domain-containing protein [Phaeovulum sp. NW3]
MTFRYFLYGTLRHPPLLAQVLGRDAEGVAARLSGVTVHEALCRGVPQGFPMLCAGGAGAPGIVVELTAPEAARLDYYESGFSFEIKEMQVETQAGPVPARVFWPKAAGVSLQPGGPWDPDAWVRDWGDLATLAAAEFMAGLGRVAPERARARYPAMLARAAARRRAGAAKPARLRRPAAPGDVRVEQAQIAYAGFFSVEDYRLSHRQFAGGHGPLLDRTAFVSVDAAVLLPYDPVRDRVLLIEQFRMGPFARGDANPWLIEPIAGRIDAGENPEEAALREAAEEAGLRIDRLIAGPSFYPSPGAKTEYLYCSSVLPICPTMLQAQAGSRPRARIFAAT